MTLTIVTAAESSKDARRELSQIWGCLLARKQFDVGIQNHGFFVPRCFISITQDAGLMISSDDTE
ncbi:hypothetical protein XI03_21025 [Bradyrhizobium sp. CCBAU 65884]|nr:hypothetical protein [Bradyrhizobium sp. CCBAU 65884]